jgi:hypothetical protein
VEVALVIIGIVLLTAAVVGGKLALGGAEIPETASVLARSALAILGIVALLLGLFPSVAGKLTPTDDDVSAPSSIPATPASRPLRPEEPLWHGTLLFESAIDFDTDPPTVTSDSDPTMDIYGGNDFPGGNINQLITFGASLKSVVKWTKPTAPTPGDCAALLQTHGVNTARFDRGDRFCVRSRDAKRIVLIAFLGQQDGTWEIYATVWRPRD